MKASSCCPSFSIGIIGGIRPQSTVIPDILSVDYVRPHS